MRKRDRSITLALLLWVASVAPGIYNDPPRGGMDFLSPPQKPRTTLAYVVLAQISQCFGIRI